MATNVCLTNKEVTTRFAETQSLVTSTQSQNIDRL